MKEKIKILAISDHPLSPSGVGIQTKYMIEGLLKTGNFKVISLGGAIKHNNYNPVKVTGYEDDWTIFPVDAYGNEEIIRSILRTERPDILWFMTDPRFYEWLWGIENEIRPLVPMVYYHVWDNYPHPFFNKKYYDSNDAIVAISKVTHDIIKTVSPEIDAYYLPHAVDSEIFKKIDSEKVDNVRKTFLKEEDEENEKFICFWNNRNARRKQSGTLMFWFKEFLDKIGHDNACLIMHTDPSDENGQDLNAIIESLSLVKGQILISNQKLAAKEMALMYNMVDCTINISDAEGFGLATLESLSCETPIIVNMTGGLQEQVTDGELWFGIGIEPASKAIIGSQNVPYIYEDRLNKEDFLAALEKMYNLWKTDKNAYEEIGKLGKEYISRKYNFEDYQKKWQETLLNIHEKYGSWENRKHYNPWELIEV